MKNEKRPEGLPTEPTKPEDRAFSAFGWVHEIVDWERGTLDEGNVDAMLLYMDRELVSLVNESWQGNLADRVLYATNKVRVLMGLVEAQPEVLNKLLMAMFSLGASAAELEAEVHTPRNKVLDAMDAKITLMRQGMPLKMKQTREKLSREFTQEKARKLWLLDHDKKLRTGEMAEIIWAWMADHPLLLEQRPTMPVLRRWISEVAREFPHASKRGRSKK